MNKIRLIKDEIVRLDNLNLHQNEFEIKLMAILSKLYNMGYDDGAKKPPLIF